MARPVHHRPRRRPRAAPPGAPRAGGAAGGGGADEPAAAVAAGGEEGGGTPLLVQGLPLVKPPWGRITAIDLGKGDIVWQVAHGETPDAVRNSPALKGV